MELGDLKKELFRRGALDGSYIEITLNNGETFSGKYTPQGEQGGINLYTTRRGLRHYESSLISSLRKIRLHIGGLSEEIRETIRELED